MAYTVTLKPTLAASIALIIPAIPEPSIAILSFPFTPRLINYSIASSAVAGAKVIPAPPCP